MAKPNKPSRDPDAFVLTHQAKINLKERPISDAYPVIDNDLARDNLENDIPAADLPD